jgi:hypothetical protein
MAPTVMEDNFVHELFHKNNFLSFESQMFFLVFLQTPSIWDSIVGGVLEPPLDTEVQTRLESSCIVGLNLLALFHYSQPCYIIVVPLGLHRLELVKGALLWLLWTDFHKGKLVVRAHCSGCSGRISTKENLLSGSSAAFVAMLGCNK